MPLMGNSEERGLIQGLQQGLTQGLTQGRRDAVTALTIQPLERRVGLLDQALREYIMALPLEELAEFNEVLRDFSSVTEVQAWLDRRQIN